MFFSCGPLLVELIDWRIYLIFKSYYRCHNRDYCTVFILFFLSVLSTYIFIFLSVDTSVDVCKKNNLLVSLRGRDYKAALLYCNGYSIQRNVSSIFKYKSRKYYKICLLSSDNLINRLILRFSVGLERMWFFFLNYT